MSRQDNARSSLFGALFIPAIILGVLIILAILVISFKSGPESASAPAGNDHSRQLDASTMADFRNKYDDIGIAIGKDDAPVTVREFADYQCPACGAFAPTARRLRENLVDSGKVRFVFFDFPLPMHAHGHQAAVAARCAARQDKFWGYHDRLFETQNDWAEKDDPTSSFLDLAVESGVDTGRLKQCMSQGATDDVIARSKKAGKAIGLRATPTVIVGNTLFSGVVPYDRLRQAIDQQSGK